jgi:hypothetical protein
MPILVQCTGCQRTMRVRDRLAGKKIKCPDCQTAFVAQALEETPTGTEPGLSSLDPSDSASSFQKPQAVANASRGHKPKPPATHGLKVFSVVGAVVLSAALVGFVVGWLLET